jgi:hypothetical protein
MLKPLKNEEGWAILSTMIAIVVGLIMMAGIFAVVDQSMDSSKLTSAQQEITMIRMNIRQLCSGMGSYTGLSDTLAESAGVFPSSMEKASEIKNPWNGAVSVGVLTDTTLFSITYEDVPQASCIKLATYDSWEAVTAAGASTDLPSDSASISSVAAAATACSSDLNTMTFYSN